ncbi:hypothetical protein ACFXTH_040460 [Malus domestica]
MKSSVFLNRHLLSRRGRSLLSTFIHSRPYDNIQMSQCICLDPLYLFSKEQLTFLLAKRIKQPTSFIILNKGAQPIPAFPSFFSRTSRQEAYMPSISTAHKAHDLLIYLKGYESYGSPSTAPQRLNPWPEPHRCPYL